MQDCIFCKIANKEINSDIVYETKNLIAFRDNNAQAPTHILLIPKDHYANILELPAEGTLSNEMILAISEIVKSEKIEESGFRVVNNCKEDGGQTVNHLHFHILGGRNLQWPPG